MTLEQRTKNAYPVDEVGKHDGADTFAHEKSMPERAERHSRDVILGPSQRATLRKNADPSQRSLAETAGRIGVMAIFVGMLIVLLSDTTVSELPKLVYDVATLQRLPCTAQDNAGAAVAFVLFLIPLFITDATVCERVCTDAGARWFLLHALGNLVVAALSLPDFLNVARKPSHALSVSYCEGLAFPGCSDWPTSMIIAMHAYHMLRFQLSSDDLFHHLLFVPGT